MTFDFVEPAVFALLSIGVIAGGVAVVMLNRITAAALLMAFTFLCMAGMFVLLGAETIALFQVLIYVGAITVLILYGVMFTKFSDQPRALFFQRQTPLAAVFVAAVGIPVAIIALSFTSATPRVCSLSVIGSVTRQCSSQVHTEDLQRAVALGAEELGRVQPGIGGDSSRQVDRIAQAHLP